MALNRARSLAGPLLALMVALAAVHGVYPAVPAWASGVAGWLAAALLAHHLGRGQRIQAAVLLGLGAAGMGYGAARGVPLPVDKVLAQNHALIAMLVAVSFLRLLSLPAASATLPTGRGAYLRTLLGLHLFGAVINMSAVPIMGDRLATEGRLDRVTLTTLSRGFSTAALWSPFFAAMAVVLTYAPGARLPVVMAAGAPLALLALGYTFVELRRLDPHGLARFRGYPVRLESLWLPGVLGLGVAGAHQLVPAWSVLTVITLIAPLLAAGALLARRGSRATLASLDHHVRERLPEMRGELVLFLCAGVLAAGLGSVFQALHGWLPFLLLTGTTASLSLLAMVGLSVLGIHPVITIATIGTWLSPLDFDPDLLAITFLMAWAIGVAAGPLSGLHLTLQGRYGAGPWSLPRWNLGYTLFMLGLCTALLHAYAGLR